jgi:hypothetical protein
MKLYALGIDLGKTAFHIEWGFLSICPEEAAGCNMAPSESKIS